MSISALHTSRVVLVGLGGISQAVHLPLIARNHRLVELAALVELSPDRLDRFGDLYGVPRSARFGSVGELVDAMRSGAIHLDAAIIATAGTHVDDTAALAAEGLAVLSEKPLAYSHTQLDRLAHALRAAGVDEDERVRIGYMKEHDPAVAELIARLSQVKVRCVDVEVLHPADGRQLSFARLEGAPTDIPRERLGTLETGFHSDVDTMIGRENPLGSENRRLWTNVVLGSAIHDIALLRHLGLGIRSVEHAHWSGEEFPGSLTAVGLCSAPSTGASPTRTTVPWHLGWHFIAEYPEYRETITIHHETGTLRLVFATPYVLNAPTRLHVIHGCDHLGSVTEEITWPQEEAFERELHTLVRLAQGLDASGSTPSDARTDLEVAHALWRACVAEGKHC